MSLKYTARHTSITPDIKEYCEKRVKSLEKYLGGPVEADLVLSVEKYRKKAEINLKSKKVTMNVTEETHDMMNSLGIAFDQVERRLKKEKDKRRERRRRRTRERIPLPPEAEEQESRKRVIRSEDYSAKPMTLEEAIMQLNLNKKDIFMFRSLGSQKWTVLYRRKDGNYGLIEPE
jgi:putative sigma-54 modulation protein